MHRPATEEARIEVGHELLRGLWTFPNLLPPSPLGVVLPDRADRDRDGATRALPRCRLLLELALEAFRSGIAVFRATPPADSTLLIDALRPLWAAATGHHLVSRARVAPLFVGDGCPTGVARLASLRAIREPLGVVLLAPSPETDLGPAAGLPVHAVLAGRAAGPPAAETAAALEDSGRAAGAVVVTTIVDDATEHLMREADWLGGRQIPHPGIVLAGVAALGRILRPAWERPARPPGLAIGAVGEATDSGPPPREV